MSNEAPAEVADDKNASQSSEGPACAEDKQGGEEEFVAAPKAPRKRTVVKKVAMESAPPAFGIDITDALFFAGLSVMHRQAKQEARKTRLSSLPIA